MKNLLCQIPSDFFPIFAYLLCSTVVGLFYAIIKNQGRLKSTAFRSDFIYFFSYALVCAALLPIFLKMTDINVLIEMSGTSYKYYLLSSYVMLVAIGGSGFIKKIVSASMGQEAMKDMEKNLHEQSYALKELVEENVATKEVSVNKASQLSEFVLKIYHHNGCYTSDTMNDSDIIELAIEKKLISKVEEKKFILTARGSFYAKSLLG